MQLSTMSEAIGSSADGLSQISMDDVAISEMDRDILNQWADAVQGTFLTQDSIKQMIHWAAEQNREKASNSATSPNQVSVSLSAQAEVTPRVIAPTVSPSSSSSTPSAAVSAASYAPFVANIAWSAISKGPLLGAGSFGDVFRAQWQGVFVALKQLHLKRPTEAVLKDFKSEAQIMAKCQHPCIVRLFGVCCDEETQLYGLVMELMEGGSLHALLHSSKPFALQDRLRVALQIAQGLQFLHSQDILHRDLKSLNVLLDAHLNAKLADFGQARVKAETAGTTTSSQAGTVRWQAPELFKPGGKHSKASDIYSLGMVLWELASRKLPFVDAPNEMTVMGWIKDGGKEEIPEDCHPDLAALIKQCWAAAEERPIADQVLLAIQQLIANLQPTSSDDSQVKSWHCDASLRSLSLPHNKRFALVAAPKSDFDKVVSIYTKQGPVPGHEIESVQVIHNPNMNRQFYGRLALLDSRHGKTVFEPKWIQQETGARLQQRQAVSDLFDSYAAPYVDDQFPHVKILPMWHGTRADVIDSIAESGFANLAQLDVGFFGKGIYTAHEAKYSCTVYGTTLLLCWVAVYSAYPVIDGDLEKLMGGANHANHDAHFAPVVPQTSSATEKNFIPCKPNQKHVYSELVVFEAASILPRYVVTLKKL